jgi:hypothetical protein
LLEVMMITSILGNAGQADRMICNGSLLPKGLVFHSCGVKI